MYSQSRPTALVDALFPVSATTTRVIRDASLVFGFVALTALLAQVRIPLGFTPVAITGQTLAVLLTGAALGSRRGATAMAVYVVAGSWLPIYSNGVSAYVWTFASGGYIVGFIPAAFLVGLLCERGWDRKPWVLVAMLAGNIVIYIPGLAQLSFFVPEGTVLEAGLYPFIPGDLIKLYIASLLLPSAWALLGLRRGNSPAP